MFSDKSANFFNTPIEYLKGVGPQRGELLRKELGINTFGDMLFHFPFRYVDRSSFIKIGNIGQDGSYVQLVGQIVYSEVVGVGRAKRLVAMFKDDTSSMELVWFQGTNWIEKIVQDGGYFLVYGKVSYFNGKWSITHPELDRLENNSLEQFTSFVPVYPSTEKLRTRSLSGRNYMKLVQALLTQCTSQLIDEVLPENILNSYKLLNRFVAIQNIHFPASEMMLQQAIYRLKFEELFVHQIGICKLKLSQQQSYGYRFEQVGDFFHTFYKNHLPFELTDDQKKVIKEIRHDTQRGGQMNRLLQGDVGSGKTIVALLCMLIALDNGFQTCLMAPTEILAQQHFLGIQALLKDMNLSVEFLTGNIKGKQRREILNRLASGEIQILIGTHALIEEAVVFKNLGLSIIDEQHRFGVAQRAKLWKKNVLPPHVLVMTATPIPRTLAMTSYGDLDVSVISQLPPGRKPIATIHRAELYRAKIMDFIKEEVDSGRQAYIVYPLIKESEKLDYENLEAGYEQVKQYFHANKYNICMVHGKMNLEDRERNMQLFVEGKAHIMVATTVIEVGVNVPNASVMLIESAERFGLSQLHQLRGRVGRGAEKSYCILLTGSSLNATARERMQTMVNESSGFAIAEKDLELRGPGDIDGTKQSGAIDFHIADIVKDVGLMEVTRNAAIALLREDSFLELPENLKLRNHLLNQKENEVWSRIS